MFFKYFFQAKNGKQQSSEVAVMLKISSIKKLSARKSAPIALLDWYDLNQELILVLERPEPCKDLQAYCQENGGSLVEEQAKVNHLCVCVCVLYTHVEVTAVSPHWELLSISGLLQIILKQLVDTARDLEENNIFHRDIKQQNILIETSSNTPRARLIDFGLSCFFTKRSSYNVFFGK